ncbi:hypothetical protein EDB89DRAFT_2005521 [Lactarius sanguifluus]|nr:hypothetical protein EDB89DRAFT_2005521 [Lactarius sanguifluus]
MEFLCATRPRPWCCLSQVVQRKSGFFKNSLEVWRKVTVRQIACDMVCSLEFSPFPQLTVIFEVLHPPRLWLRLIALELSRSRRKRCSSNCCQTCRRSACGLLWRLRLPRRKKACRASHYGAWTQPPLGCFFFCAYILAHMFLSLITPIVI